MTLTRADRLSGLAVVTVALGVASLIHGLTLPLLSLVLEREGVGKTLIGINTAAQYLAIFAAAPFVPRLMRNFGPIAMMFWSVLGSALVFLLLPLYVDVQLWFALRLLLGVSLSFLWIAGEAWVSHMAEERTQGRIVAVYGAVTASGFALGPLLLAMVGSRGWTPFLVAAGVMALGAIPLSLHLRSAPKLQEQASGGFWRYVMLAPAAMWVYFMFSAADAVLLTFLPIYGMQAGLDERLALGLLTALAVGAIASQFPIGWLVDRMNAMVLFTVGVVLIGGTSALLPLSIAKLPGNAALMFGFGALLGGFYTVTLVVHGRRFKGAELGPATTARSVMFCLGATAGPPVAGTAMEWLGPHGMPWSLVLMFALVLPLPILGVLRKWVA